MFQANNKLMGNNECQRTGTNKLKKKTKIIMLMITIDKKKQEKIKRKLNNNAKQ